MFPRVWNWSVTVGSVRVVNEKEWVRRPPKAQDRVAEGAEGVESWEGVCPSQKICLFYFLSGSGEFWCILGACFDVSIRRVKVKTESTLLLYKKNGTGVPVRSRPTRTLTGCNCKSDYHVLAATNPSTSKPMLIIQIFRISNLWNIAVIYHFEWTLTVTTTIYILHHVPQSWIQFSCRRLFWQII